jgi:DNA-binding NarL/FixJ family response regulator
MRIYLNPEASCMPLTRREWDILLAICEGLNNLEIAQRYYLSLSTVRAHIYHIFKKLEVINRCQAAVLALSQDWIGIECGAGELLGDPIDKQDK